MQTCSHHYSAKKKKKKKTFSLTKLSNQALVCSFKLRSLLAYNSSVRHQKKPENVRATPWHN